MAKTPRSGENRGRRTADRRRVVEAPQSAETSQAASSAQVSADVTTALAAADARQPGRPSRDAIARRAFELFMQRGGTHGYDIEDWLRAERELRGK